jgi:hypothetical protein
VLEGAVDVAVSSVDSEFGSEESDAVGALEVEVSVQDAAILDAISSALTEGEGVDDAVSESLVLVEGVGLTEEALGGTTSTSRGPEVGSCVSEEDVEVGCKSVDEDDDWEEESTGIPVAVADGLAVTSIATAIFVTVVMIVLVVVTVLVMVKTDEELFASVFESESTCVDGTKTRFTL